MLRYALTIFLGAFLLFLVQPLIGKYILPWFGGGPGVWTACLLFFQTALLAGYAYAHLVAMRLPAKTQAWVHIGVLLAAFFCLPIVPADAWQPVAQGNPVLQIIILLSYSVGVPFVALAATGPLLQSWFSRTHPGVSPYRMYAVSNVGSLLALVCYPFVMEPAFSRRIQAMIWSGGFIAFMAMCGWCAIQSRSAPVNAATDDDVEPERERSRRFDVLLWLALPACVSVMLLAVTSQLSEEVAPIPFLWVLTLGIYLLTFIISFEWPKAYHRGVLGAAALFSPWLVWLMLLNESIALGWQMAVYLIVLFACGMVCHGELYRLRPRVSRLTGYYLCIAAGGAMGGAFVAIAGPIIFTRNIEFYLAIYAAIALLLACQFLDPASIFHRGARRLGWLGIIGIALAAGMLLRTQISHLDRDVIVGSRNFYGSLSLRMHQGDRIDVQYRKLDHGRITHGAQHYHERALEIRRLPTMYYGANTGVGIALRGFPKIVGRRVGVVGLGVGTLATFANPGDVYRFYEINPDVHRYAEEYFSFLADARARGVTIETVIEDARMALDRESAQQFDVLVLDAFSGDAIPVHLLTTESFVIYKKHLADSGAIAVHVSNRYLDLRPIVHRLGEAAGFSTVFIDTPPDTNAMIAEAMWVVLTRNQAVLNLPEIRRAGVRPPSPYDAPLWTDDHHSLFSALR